MVGTACIFTKLYLGGYNLGTKTSALCLFFFQPMPNKSIGVLSDLQIELKCWKFGRETIT